MRFIVAENSRAAEATADIDWNWERRGPLEWMDHEGERVRYASNINSLRGHRGTVVWLGYNWFKNPELCYDLVRFAESHDMTLKHAADWSPNALPRAPHPSEGG